MFKISIVKNAHYLLTATMTVTLLTATSPLAMEKFKAITTFTVIADMARNVAGDAANVESITKAGAEVHGYQPTPKDIVRAQNADLILWNGLNLELWFEQFFSNLQNVPSAILTNGITPMSITGGEYGEKPNPHAWMSLENALIYIDNIRDAFMRFDHKNAQTYQKNAADYKEKLSQVVTPLKKAIVNIPLHQRWLVSCEGAFSYLARDFKLYELYLWPINSEAQGTPQQVRRVIDSVRENNIPAVFCESTVSSAPIKQVVRETEASYGGVLYVDSLTEVDGAVPTYLDLLRVTSETILAGLTN